MSLSSSVLLRADEERGTKLPSTPLVGGRGTRVAELLVTDLVREGGDGLTASESRIKNDGVANPVVFTTAVVAEVGPLDVDAEVRAVLEKVVEAISQPRSWRVALLLFSADRLLLLVSRYQVTHAVRGRRHLAQLVHAPHPRPVNRAIPTEASRRLARLAIRRLDGFSPDPIVGWQVAASAKSRLEQSEVVDAGGLR